MRTLDLNGYKKIQKMKGVDCCFKNGLIELENNLIAIGGKGVILLVDYMKWEKIKVIKSDFIRDVNVYSIVSQFNILLCGCGKGKFCQIDLNTGDVNYGLVKMHDKNIFALALLENNHIASGSYDNTIRIWKYELE
jgi:WD40 repeat protein